MEEVNTELPSNSNVELPLHVVEWWVREGFKQVVPVAVWEQLLALSAPGWPIAPPHVQSAAMQIAQDMLMWPPQRPTLATKIFILKANWEAMTNAMLADLDRIEAALASGYPNSLNLANARYIRMLLLEWSPEHWEWTPPSVWQTLVWPNDHLRSKHWMLEHDGPEEAYDFPATRAEALRQAARIAVEKAAGSPEHAPASGELRS